MGLQHPQRGDVRILGEPAWELSAAGKERLGYVPQKIDLYPWMKIRQITAYTGAFYPRWNKALVERLLREWELNPEDRVGPLSVGQTQKLAIILALGHEPDLLVLDEPAASLDPVARRQFLETLLDMVGEPRCFSQRTSPRTWSASPTASRSSRTARSSTAENWMR